MDSVASSDKTCHTRRTDKYTKQKEGRQAFPLSRQSSVLILLESRVSGTSLCRLIIANHTSLVGEEAALTSGAPVGRVGKQRIRIHHCAHRGARVVGEGVAALDRIRHTQNVVQDVRAGAVTRAGTEKSQAVSVSERRTLSSKSYQPRVNRANRTNRR